MNRFSTWWSSQTTFTKIGWIVVALFVLSLLLLAWNTFASSQGVASLVRLL
ncbi:MAG TPA: hypothetical protein VHW68_09320 [Actinomycetota bacterium]|jgi:hypothetical protein|nr:hypothetical protein [Actinomycetota bacterium]